MYSKLSNILNDINNILLPRVCFGCNTHLYKGERLICTVCRNQLPLTEYNYNDENAVDRIFYGRISIKKASSFLFFTKNGIVKNLIHQLKYKNRQEIGIFLGDWYGQVLREDIALKTIDFVIPVPLHKRKLKLRGYNQVTTFARQLAEHLEATYEDTILQKTIHTKTQTHKNRLKRSQTKSDAYRVTNRSTLKHKTVLLVDDIVTTGSTLEACADAMNDIPGISIYIATMAVAL